MFIWQQVIFPNVSQWPELQSMQTLVTDGLATTCTNSAVSGWMLLLFCKYLYIVFLLSVFESNKKWYK